MRRRKLIAAVVGVISMIAASALFVVWQQESLASVRKISLANFLLLKPGTPLEEAITILGPPGHHATRKTVIDDATQRKLDMAATLQGGNRIDTFGESAKEDSYMWWCGDSADVIVFCDKSGKLTWGQFIPLKQAEESRFARFRKDVERQWKEWLQ
jgi:hypothetical protein